MNIRDNRGINLISLTVTIIILLVITGAMIFNTKNQISAKEINALRNDIELLSAKIDDYYLKYGELPELCYYSNKKNFREGLFVRADAKGATLNSEVNPNDGDEYVVIELEKLEGLTLNYGYEKNGEYFTIKQSRKVNNFANNPDKIEDEIFVINTKTHQVYFPHGIFAEGVMYYTF